MTPIQITSFTLTTALGFGLSENWQKISSSNSGLKPCNFFNSTDLNTWTGEIEGLDRAKLPTKWREYDCRNNRLALMSLEQDNFLQEAQTAIRKYGANRVGLFLGSSTSGIHQTEKAYLQTNIETETLPDWYQYRHTHNIFSVVEFVRNILGISGPSTVISTACSSSAKVFASAYRMISTGMCDAAILGGVDTLCLTTLYGFKALQLTGEDICRPFDANRSGISIGEAGGFALIEKNSDAEFSLCGYGESSDAYHMSSPHPEGEGAYRAMNSALKRANLTPGQIDYINLHGTGTTANDIAESRAINHLFGNALPCSSTKGWTGHTLGAAGIVEVTISLLALRHKLLPANLNTNCIDHQVDANILLKHQQTTPHYVATNSFGFGGSNCCLVLGRNQ